MTYNPNKPDPGPSPRLDAPNIRNNFSSWNTNFNANHTAMNNRFQGDHEDVIFELQTVDPGVTEDLVALYSKNVTTKVDTQPELFFQIKKFLPTEFDTYPAENTPMQLTYNTVNTAGPVYQSFLPGGYVIYFGSTNDITTNITLSPAPTTILIAIATPNNMTTVGTPIPYSVSTTIISNTDFKINSTLNAGGPVVPYTFGWVAIAKQ